MAKSKKPKNEVGFTARSNYPPRPGFFGGNKGFGNIKGRSQKFGSAQFRTQHKG